MSEQRRPTLRFGRKRDPRADSVPPSARSKDAKPSDPKREAATTDGPPSSGGGDIDELLGRLLARATQAEVHAQQLEKTLARMNEERVLVEARMSELVRQLEDADTNRASLEAQARTVNQSRRTDGPVTLAYARSMAAELVRALDRLSARPSQSDLPAPRTPSDVPTPRPRSDRPRR